MTNVGDADALGKSGHGTPSPSRPTPGRCLTTIAGTQNLCTRPSGHEGEHRCSAADVDARPSTLHRWVAPGSTSRREPCGCEIAGYGLLPDPWRVTFCPMHAAAPDLLAALTALYQAVPAARPDQDDLWKANALARAALAKARP